MERLNKVILSCLALFGSKNSKDLRNKRVFTNNEVVIDEKLR